MVRDNGKESVGKKKKWTECHSTGKVRTGRHEACDREEGGQLQTRCGRDGSRFRIIGLKKSEEVSLTKRLRQDNSME